MERVQFHRSVMGSSMVCSGKKAHFKKKGNLHYLPAPNSNSSSQGARVPLPSRLSGIPSPPDLSREVSLSQMTSTNPANVNGWNIFKGAPLLPAATGLFCLSERKQRNVQFILNNVHLSQSWRFLSPSQAFARHSSLL